MQNSTHIGLDVHKVTISVEIAQGGPPLELAVPGAKRHAIFLCSSSSLNDLTQKMRLKPLLQDAQHHKPLSVH